MSVIDIPTNYALPPPDYYCIPLGYDVGTGGDGLTPATAVHGLKQLRDLMNTTPGLGGIRVGYDVDLSAEMSLTATAGLMAWTAKDDADFGLTAWREEGDGYTPSRVIFSKLCGTTTGQWERVSLAGNPGDTVATANVYTLDAGSDIWHLTDSVTNRVVAIGCGSRASIEAVVDSTNYRQHTYNSAHVDTSYLEDSGANAIINTSAVQRVPFTLDTQWCWTENGGLLVKSATNPATRWGGVYVMQQEQSVFHVQECPTFQWHYALQGYACSSLVRVRNNGPTAVAADFTGLGFDNCGIGIQWLTDQGPPSSGSGQGAIHMGRGTNATVFGDGSTPWITLTIKHVRFRYQNGRLFNGLRWWHNSVIEDVEGDLANLQDWGFAFFSNCVAGYTDRNVCRNWRVSHVHCGVGKFGRTDFAIDCDGMCDGHEFYNLEIFDSFAPFQFTGSRGWCQVLRHSILWRCPRPVDITDGPNDGANASKVTNCTLGVESPALWALGALGVSGGFDFAKGVGIAVRKDIGFATKGDAADTDVQGDQDGVGIDSNIIVNIDGASDCYAQQNETIGAAATEGPWHAVGGVGTVANNGRTVPNNQQQLRAQRLSSIPKAHFFGFAVGKRIVDIDFADATGTQTTGSAADVSDPLLTSTFFLIASSAAELRTGASIRDAVTIVTDVNYTQIATNVRDKRNIPRWSKKTSYGAYQDIPLCPVLTRGL